jgi:carboxyl-terminal processing protease
MNKNWQPLIYGILLGIGVIAGILMRPPGGGRSLLSSGTNKFAEIIDLVNAAYVDTVNYEQLENDAINQVLQQLDPHSVYIPASELKAVNEPLEGNFEGIGIEFNIISDTIVVVTPIAGGPAYQLGIQSGDRIVKVNGKNVAHVNIRTEDVVKLLKGKKGTEVKVSIYRSGVTQLIDYTIVRNTIPIYSVDAAFMLNKESGYIKVSRFSATTHEEFRKALEKLQRKGMQHMILDLRGNPGGYLSAATEMCDELLDDDKLIVYTKGRNSPRNDYKASRKGLFEEGKLVVLIDEGSASASEIVSGAMQDWDRGVIVGRRSFGKGLVQEPFQLKDGSAVRLTVSRYYTPSGRSIQKPYDDNVEAYEHEIFDRDVAGEKSGAADTLSAKQEVFTTQAGRKVYGGGGIKPDLIQPYDTSFSSPLLTRVYAEGLLNRFAFRYAELNRQELKGYLGYMEFEKMFNAEKLLYSFLQDLRQQGIPCPDADVKRSGVWIGTVLKALLARQQWKDEGYYYVLNRQDKTIATALSAMQQYDKLLKP